MLFHKKVVLTVSVLLSATLLGYAPRSYDVKSEAMGKTVPVTILLPKGYDEHPEKQYRVVYLLHGAGDTAMRAYHPLFRAAGDRHGLSERLSREHGRLRQHAVGDDVEAGFDAVCEIK